MITMPITSWSAYKTLVALKKISIQYNETSSLYNLFAIENQSFVWTTVVYKDGGDEVTEFETLKSGYNQPMVMMDVDGVELHRSRAFANSDGMRFRGKGISGTATKNSTTNIDYKLTEERYINGVQIICKDHVFGDNLKFQVVDIDNIVGYGAGVVLDEFGSTWYLAEGKQDQGIIALSYPAKIIVNLYIRVVYISTGITNDVSVQCNLFLHKKT